MSLLCCRKMDLSLQTACRACMPRTRWRVDVHAAGTALYQLLCSCSCSRNSMRTSMYLLQKHGCRLAASAAAAPTQSLRDSSRLHASRTRLVAVQTERLICCCGRNSKLRSHLRDVLLHRHRMSLLFDVAAAESANEMQQQQQQQQLTNCKVGAAAAQKAAATSCLTALLLSRCSYGSDQSSIGWHLCQAPSMC